MKKWPLAAITLTVAFLLNGSLHAEEFLSGGSITDDFDCCCDPCGGGWVADAELMFLRYHRAGGLGATTANEFDFAASPRLTLGYEGPSGFGARVRYWEYDQVNKAQNVSVDTFNLDFEVFQEIQLNSNTSVEMSAGIRKNDFEEIDSGVFPLLGIVIPTSFSGWGGLLGVEVNRESRLGTLYAHGRYAVLMGDIDTATTAWGGLIPTPTTTAFSGIDHTGHQMEIGLGIERSFELLGATATATAGVEWSNWSNYSYEFRSVGFGGLVLGLGVNY